MDNIIMDKSWGDEGFLELKVRAVSEFVDAHQYCYIQREDLKRKGDIIIDYVKNDGDCYVEFGIKNGNYTPAFSLNFLQANLYGHVKIEVDIEIDDNNSRCHRCSYYVNSELGSIEQFGEELIQLSNDLTRVELHKVY